MKKILLALTVLLSGCTIVDAYLMTKYDPNEYQIITSIRAEAGHAQSQCDSVSSSRYNATKISYDTQIFVLYSQHIPRNDNLLAAAKALDTIAQGLADQYRQEKVSPAFCKIKFESIEASAEKMQKVIGGRPR